MMILAFDTALGACTVGVWSDGAIIAQESHSMTQGHAEALMPMIERVMAAAHITYFNLDRIAVSVGPGSFTGLRVGIATARGLAMASHKPALGVTTTQSLAMGVPEAERTQNILVVIDSKRNDVYAQVFGPAGQKISEIANVGFEALSAWCPDGPLLVVGDAAARTVEVLGARATVSSAATVCGIDALGRIAATQTIDPQGPMPVYVRAPDVTLSPSGGQLRP